MSLFSSIQLANNALFATQIGLQVTGNNIANANTPGYLRQRVLLTPAPTQLFGNLPLGLGVEVKAIVQETDRFLTERLRAAISDVSNSESQEQSYLQLEALIGELTEQGLSRSLNSFFAAINDILNQPEDISVRNLAVLQGKALAAGIGRLDSRVRSLRANVNDQVVSAADDINRLLEEIAQLNVKVVVTEGGSTSASDAVGIRDQRDIALAELAELIGIRSVEQPNGAITVFAGGDFLVFEGEYRTVNTSFESDRGLSVATVNIEDSDSPVTAATGKLAGLYAARDEVLGGFLDQIELLTQTLAFEFNKVYSSGQGLVGFEQLTSEFAVEDADAALDQAGLAFTPVNGSFQVRVTNTRSGTVETTDLLVALNGLDDDTTLNDLVAALDGIDGISAVLTPDLQVQLTADSADIEFSFAEDTSGVLAALGLNVFFTGSTALNLDVSSVVRQAPGTFAASRGGIANDSANAVRLAGFINQPIDAQDGQSLIELYESIIGDVAQGSSVTKAVSEGFRVFHRTLEGEHLGLSGVSVDDEAVKLITYQRVFQASAKFIATASELLELLVNL